MAAHSSVLAWRIPGTGEPGGAWRIPGTGEPGGLPSMGLQSRIRLKRLSSSSKHIYIKRQQLNYNGLLKKFILVLA